jgi:hypothetical protein
MSLAADSRRARYRLLRTADLSGSRTPCQEPFPISSFTFVLDDAANYIASFEKAAEIRQSPFSVIHQQSQLLETHPLVRCKTRWKT